MKTVNVELGERRYPIIVGSGLLKGAATILSEAGFRTAPFVVTNATVFRYHGRALQRGFPQPLVVKTIGDGERFKDHATLLKVYDHLFRHGADRRSWILAFGGGVVGDLAGFAAATFMRGIPYTHVPTTLLAQVDSAIGGKVGINVPQGKNLIGAFHQPRAVISDTSLLRTLPARELAAGLFEVIKTGAIRSEPLLAYIETNLQNILRCRPEVLDHVVLEASRIKAEVVSGDEREADARMALNYGHTIGHALEAATEYRRFKHGEAVAWGMVGAIRFGRELGFMTDAEAARLTALITRVEKLPPLSRIDADAAWMALKRDKKFRSGAIRMVFLPRLGESVVCSDIETARLKQFLKRFLTESTGGANAR